MVRRREGEMKEDIRKMEEKGRKREEEDRRREEEGSSRKEEGRRREEEGRREEDRGREEDEFIRVKEEVVTKIAWLTDEVHLSKLILERILKEGDSYFTPEEILKGLKNFDYNDFKSHEKKFWREIGLKTFFIGNLMNSTAVKVMDEFWRTTGGREQRVEEERGESKKKEEGGRKEEEGGRKKEEGGRKVKGESKKKEGGGKKEENGDRNVEVGGEGGKKEGGGIKAEGGGQRKEEKGRKEEGGRKKEERGKEDELEEMNKNMTKEEIRKPELFGNYSQKGIVYVIKNNSPKPSSLSSLVHFYLPPSSSSDLSMHTSLCMLASSLEAFASETLALKRGEKMEISLMQDKSMIGLYIYLRKQREENEGRKGEGAETKGRGRLETETEEGKRGEGGGGRGRGIGRLGEGGRVGGEKLGVGGELLERAVSKELGGGLKEISSDKLIPAADQITIQPSPPINSSTSEPRILLLEHTLQFLISSYTKHLDATSEEDFASLRLTGLVAWRKKEGSLWEKAERLWNEIYFREEEWDRREKMREILKNMGKVEYMRFLGEFFGRGRVVALSFGEEEGRRMEKEGYRRIWMEEGGGEEKGGDRREEEREEGGGKCI